MQHINLHLHKSRQIYFHYLKSASRVIIAESAGLIILGQIGEAN